MAANRAWRLLADPHNLPRWWPETVRVESVEGAPGARRSRFTQVFESTRGKAVRADYRIIDSTQGERLVWEQRIEGTPFEKFLRSAALEMRLDAEDAEQQPDHDRGAAQPARRLAARLADDEGRDEALARRGARWDRARARAPAGRRQPRERRPCAATTPGGAGAAARAGRSCPRPPGS